MSSSPYAQEKMSSIQEETFFCSPFVILLRRIVIFKRQIGFKIRQLIRNAEVRADEKHFLEPVKAVLDYLNQFDANVVKIKIEEFKPTQF